MINTTTLSECPVGLFRAVSGELGFKTQYRGADGRIDAFVVRSGEYFWGGTSTPLAQAAVPVVPLAGVDMFPDAVAPEPVTVFLLEVADEIERAAMLFPGPNPNLAALSEEAGELAQAILEAYQHKQRQELFPFDWEIIRSEAVQVAAMAFRVAYEGDPIMGVVPDEAAP